MLLRTMFVSLLFLGLTVPPADASPTARASGVLAIHTGPGDVYSIVDKLKPNERVAVASCTRQARWCLVKQLDGGPSGWVPGSYLVGSPAKTAVTPFEFSFDPLDPGGFFRHR